MGIVAFDTNALIWAIKDECSPGQEEMKRRARFAMKEVERDGYSIVVPTVCLAELMVPMNDQQSTAFANVISDRFTIAPLDARAASVAAKLWRTHRELPAAERTKRNVLKADALLIASAVCAGATRFYSHDRRCRNLAMKVLNDVRDLPTMGGELFDDL